MQGRGPVYADKPAEKGRPTYLFAIHPLYNPTKLTADFQPLMEYLNARMSAVAFDLEASRNYPEYEKKFRARQAEVLLPNPWQTLEALKAGYEVIAIAGRAEDFKGLFIVRRDSGLRSIADLKGRIVAYPAKTALAACIMPQWHLHTHGIDVNKDLTNLFVGSQESAIMNTCLGLADAGVTWPPPWRSFQREHPREAAQLMVLDETPPLINNSVMVRNDVPAAIRDQLRQLLLTLHETAEGRAILAGFETERFLPGSAADYDVVRAYVARFEREVHRIEP
ncbi:MAG: phosphate/phosphite/phosphonate ABC transporter substrate-binding protein [Opitutales bacterium]